MKMLLYINEQRLYQKEYFIFVPNYYFKLTLKSIPTQFFLSTIYLAIASNFYMIKILTVCYKNEDNGEIISFEIKYNYNLEFSQIALM